MKLLLALMLLLSASWIAPPPAEAQNTSDQSRCRSALSTAEDLLINGRNLWIADVSTYSVGETYANYPYQSPVGFVVVMAGDAAPDMMMSPRLLTSIAETMMGGCPGIGLVTFGVAGTDWTVDFGLIGNQVREFECIDSDGVDNFVPWGYTVCL